MDKDKKEAWSLISEKLRFQTGRELLFKRGYFYEDAEAVLDRGGDVDEIYRNNEEMLSTFIDEMPCFYALPPERKADLKKFVAACGNIVAIGEGMLSVYLYPEEEKIDVDIESCCFSLWEERMEFIRYITSKALEIDVDIEYSEEDDDIILTFIYKY